MKLYCLYPRVGDSVVLAYIDAEKETVEKLVKEYNVKGISKAEEFVQEILPALGIRTKYVVTIWGVFGYIDGVDEYVEIE